jgi:predicted permease
MFMQDLRYTLRSLWRTPGFTVVALLTLMLGLGANTAMFSIVNGILLEPLPYGDPDRLVSLHQANPKQGVRYGRVSLPDFEDWGQSGAFEPMAAYDVIPQVLTGQGEPIEMQAAYVTANFFAVLDVPAQRGRVLNPNDHTQAARHVVISDRLWRTRLSADPGVLGRPILLRGEPYTVVGITPASFRYPTPDTDAWIPESVLGLQAIGPRVRDNRIFEGIARLKPGRSLAQAQADLNAVAARLATQHPESNAEWNATSVVPLRTAIVGDVNTALLVMLSVVGFILLIACANLANLLLARGAGRAREIAIRTALGAGRMRIVRQLLTENIVLALFGGVLALLLTFWGVRAVLALSADTLPRVETVRIDARVIGFGLLLSIVTGLLFGLVPAMRVVLAGPQRDLRSGRGTVGHGHTVRNALVAAEVAMAVALVIGAGLMARSFLTLRSINPGFNPEQVLTVSLQLNLTGVPESGLAQHIFRRRQEIIDRVSTLPGVVHVGMINNFPLRDERNVFAYARTDGRGPADGSPLRADTRYINPDYIKAMGIALKRGEPLPPQRTKGAPAPMLLSESAARRFFPGEEAVGQPMKASWGTSLLVVGVVADVRQSGLDEEPMPSVYLLQSTAPRLMATVVVRTQGDPLALAGPVRQVIRELDPNQPIRSVSTLRGVMSESVARDRFFTLLFGMFGGLALVLAAVGVYGVVAYAVGQRTKEIGMRIALGARSADVLRMVVKEGMMPVLVGIVIGGAASLLLTRALQTQLYGISTKDPVAFLIAPAVLLTAALLACYIPARRATRIDPMMALRNE